MYGAILFWRVRPECLAEHEAIMREALEAERDRCPELLLNLPFGPSADGTFGAVQVYADEASYRAFPERVRREDARLWELWEASGALSESSAARTFHFEGMSFLDEGFVRLAAGLGHVERSGERREMLRIVDLIAKKRAGGELSADELAGIVDGYVRGDVPDYQVAAWLMAVCWRGMSRRETTDLTLLLARSGEMLDLGELGARAVDKHSTGGVGDKTTLAVAPLVAACGVPVVKLSGRGLGFTGGTLDKLESIPGLRVSLSIGEFVRQVERIGLAIASQSADLAPADGKLYALRDVTATVESIPLIASSVMGKKLAAGAGSIVLDVKAGRGAFMKRAADAISLAETMVDIGIGAGRRVSAVISSMEQPLGNAVGNALEVREAVQTLRGEGPPDFAELVRALSTRCLLTARAAANQRDATETLDHAWRSGAGLAKLAEMVAAQGGDPRYVEDPELLPRAPIVEEVRALRSGYVQSIDAESVGLTAGALGAGRARKGDPIDPAVGIVLRAKVGDGVRSGDPLAEVHARTEKAAAEASRRLLAATVIGDGEVAEQPLILAVRDMAPQAT